MRTYWNLKPSEGDIPIIREGDMVKVTVFRTQKTVREAASLEVCALIDWKGNGIVGPVIPIHHSN